MPRKLHSTFLWSSWACLAPVLALAVVIGATAHFNGLVNLGQVTVRPDLGSPEAPFEPFAVTPAGRDLPGVAGQLVVRLGWAVTAIALVVMSVVALGGGLLFLWRWVRALEPRRRWLFLAGAAVLVAAILVERTSGLTGDWLVAEPEVFTDLRKATLYDADLGFPRADSETGSQPRAMEDLELAADAENALVLLSYLSFVALLAAASASLAMPSRDLPHDERQALVTARARGVRWLLYLGSGVLVLHALEMYAFYRWPGAWLPTEQAEVVNRMAHAVSTANGAFFSLLLLALYLPAAGVLRLRSLELLEDESTGAAPAESRQRARDQGVLASPFQELSALLVTLGPLLAGGPLAGALDLLNL